jgi:probable HAF family extracellular repeat protein
MPTLIASAAQKDLAVGSAGSYTKASSFRAVGHLQFRLEVAMRYVKVAFAVAILFSVAAGNAWGAARYSVTDLGTLGGFWSEPFGINASGQVVGGAAVYSVQPYGPGHAFLYSEGMMTDLGTLLGVSTSAAYGLNASGQVVGYASNSGGNWRHAFLYSNGTMTDLGTLPGDHYSSASGINASGQVVGVSEEINGGYSRAFLYSNGSMTNLGTLPGCYWSRANAINDNGQVAGYSYGDSTRAFLYSNGTMTDLGLGPGGLGSEASALNANGQVVGFFETSSGWAHAFLYGNGTMTDLGTLGGDSSHAYGINASGQVVGDAYTGLGYDHPFLYSNGTMTDLTSLIDPIPGWTLLRATAINDRGQIVCKGQGTIGSYEFSHAFLLTPIPEPSTLALLSIGAIGLLGYAWRRVRH